MLVSFSAEGCVFISNRPNELDHRQGRKHDVKYRAESLPGGNMNIVVLSALFADVGVCYSAYLCMWRFRKRKKKHPFWAFAGKAILNCRLLPLPRNLQVYLISGLGLGRLTILQNEDWLRSALFVGLFVHLQYQSAAGNNEAASGAYVFRPQQVRAPSVSVLIIMVVK